MVSWNLNTTRFRGDEGHPLLILWQCDGWCLGKTCSSCIGVRGSLATNWVILAPLHFPWQVWHFRHIGFHFRGRCGTLKHFRLDWRGRGDTFSSCIDVRGGLATKWKKHTHTPLNPSNPKKHMFVGLLQGGKMFKYQAQEIHRSWREYYVESKIIIYGNQRVSPNATPGSNKALLL